MEVHYTPAVLGDLKRIGPVTAARVRGKILVYANNPAAFGPLVKKLQGSEALRLRAGDYRILFVVRNGILNVLRVGHRREIYR